MPLDRRSPIGVALAALALCLSIGLSENRLTLFGPVLVHWRRGYPNHDRGGFSRIAPAERLSLEAETVAFGEPIPTAVDLDVETARDDEAGLFRLPKGRGARLGAGSEFGPHDRKTTAEVGRQQFLHSPRLAYAKRAPAGGAHDGPLFRFRSHRRLVQEEAERNLERLGEGAQVGQRRDRQTALHLAQPPARSAELVGNNGERK